MTACYLAPCVLQSKEGTQRPAFTEMIGWLAGWDYDDDWRHVAPLEVSTAGRCPLIAFRQRHYSSVAEDLPCSCQFAG